MARISVWAKHNSPEPLLSLINTVWITCCTDVPWGWLEVLLTNGVKKLHVSCFPVSFIALSYKTAYLVVLIFHTSFGYHYEICMNICKDYEINVFYEILSCKAAKPS